MVGAAVLGRWIENRGADREDRAMNAIHDELGTFSGSWGGWTREIEGLSRVCDACVPDSPDDKLTPTHVMRALNRVVDEADIVAAVREAAS